MNVGLVYVSSTPTTKKKLLSVKSFKTHIDIGNEFEL